ncbi:MAG: Gfo/Idh/MocA family oxidoreductase [Bacteroidota bacterium]
MHNAPSVLLFGHGYWGKNIARNLYALGALGGVCEPDPGQVSVLAERYPDIPVYATVDQALKRCATPAVAISTPAATHAELALRCLTDGRDVFVEKPLALTVADGDALVDRARQTGRILMVGHLLEYHPAVVELDRLVRTGALGALQYLYSNRLNLGKFRREENSLWSFAPHDIAVILRLVGSMPKQIKAFGGAYLRSDVADTTVTHLSFDGGVQAHIFVSWLHPYKEQRLVVVGAERMAVFDDREPWSSKLVVHDKGADWVGNDPIPRAGAGTPVQLDEAEPLREELAHFLTCVRDQCKPLTDGENGVRVLRVLEDAQNDLRRRID